MINRQSGPMTRNFMLSIYRRTYSEEEAQRRAREFMQNQHNIYRRVLKKNVEGNRTA